MITVSIRLDEEHVSKTCTALQCCCVSSSLTDTAFEKANLHSTKSVLDFSTFLVNIMIIFCAWCDAFLYEKEPLENKQISHGICPTCFDAEVEKDIQFRKNSLSNVYTTNKPTYNPHVSLDSPVREDYNEGFAPSVHAD